MRNYEYKWYPFDQHPDCDCCWSLSAGPDGRIYAAACCETVPGGIVKVFRYNDRTDGLDFVLSMDDATGESPESGRASQCKIHYSFAPSQSDGVLYMATHLSAPPLGKTYYSPWLSWHNEKECFRGAALIAYDTNKESVQWSDTLYPKEGCRTLLIDESRGLLYSLSYPRDHLFVYDIEKRKSRDLGRIGSINSQVLLLDSRGRVWTAGDYGNMICYDPDEERLRWADAVVPHKAGIQKGWHSVLYDAAQRPGSDEIFAVPWSPYPRLMKIVLEGKDEPYIEDLRAVTKDYDNRLPADMFVDHCGGLVFAPDGMLYFVSSHWENQADNPWQDMRGRLFRMNPDTYEREMAAELVRPGGSSQYVSRGAADRNGDLFFANVNHFARPVGIFRVVMPEDRRKKDAHLPLRIWG